MSVPLDRRPLCLFSFRQGGFAKCYELVDPDTAEVFAGKIVPKSILLKPHHRQKVNNFAPF